MIKTKERFIVDRLYNEEKEKDVCYEFRQLLIWQFYIRTLKSWFIPCGKCQNVIDKEYTSCVQIGDLGDLNRLPTIIFPSFCKECKEIIRKKLVKANEVIIGNKDYEPVLELSRRWETDDGLPLQALGYSVYPHTKEISEAEYQSRKGLKC